MIRISVTVERKPKRIPRKRQRVIDALMAHELTRTRTAAAK